MKTKKKHCDGCDKDQYIWKNVTENGERKRYCKYCWSAHEGKKVTKPTTRKTPLRSRSPKRAKQESQYNKKARRFKKENPYCQISIQGVCTGKTHDVHHMKGRENDLLLNEQYWKATCRKCHEWVTVNSKQAIALGHSISRYK